MDIQRQIAANAKKLRQHRGLTLDEAAKLTGVSRSMLAQIERAEVNPTISVLWKIANGYRVSFSSLMEGDERRPLLLRLEEVAPLTEGDGRYVNYPAFAFQKDRPFETYRIQIRPGGSLCAQPHLKGAEEYITVFAGQVEIVAGGEAFSLSTGDSLRFMADVPHAYRNTGDGDALLSMLIYYGE